MDTAQELPRVLSLCTGYGGLERGIEAIIGKCTGLAYVEIEAFAIANLVNKMETGKMDPVPIWTDIKTFNARIFRGKVDILTGGYPCQPFSAAGKREGTKDPRHLWPYIRTIIMDCRPRTVFFENVEGHLSLGISEVLSDLEEMGYRVEAGIFSAAEVGAPHQRKRVFIMAESSDDRWGPTTATEKERATELRKTGPKGRIENGKSSLRLKGFSCDELGNSQSNNERWLSEQIGDRERMQIGGSSSNVPNTISNGSRKSDRVYKSEFSYQNGKKWPARPEQTQHEWEEPRVVADSKNLQREAIERSPENGILQQNIGEGKVKPELGGAASRTSSRVDRLRLLGNGVVWQTAAKAFFVLSQKLNSTK